MSKVDDKSKTKSHKMSKSTQVEKEKQRNKGREQTKKAQAQDMPKVERGENMIQSGKANYEIKEELGQGAFGAVFKVCRDSDKKPFAMKCESLHVKKQILAHEARVLLALNLLQSAHFVELIDNGKVENRFLFVVIKLVGQNLWDIRIGLPERKYTLNTALKIAEQTLEGIRDLHRVGFLHRDIKPPNFAVGREEDDTLHTVYVLDFGLCRKICQKGVDLRTPRSACAFRGTTRYAALAAHDAKEQSRKDDIESWWYMTVEMMVGEIPWKTCKGTDRDGVRVLKKKIRDEETMKMVFHKGCYEQMSAILFYLDGLSYTSIPDYDFVYKQLNAAMQVMEIDEKTPVDWDNRKEYNGPKYKMGEPYLVKELQ